MFYIFILLLLLYFAASILLVKAKLFSQLYPDAHYRLSMSGYAVMSIALFALTFISTFFTDRLDWWMEILAIALVTPISGFLGTALARGQYKHETDFRTPDGKGTDIAKMAEHYRKKAGK